MFNFESLTKRWRCEQKKLYLYILSIYHTTPHPILLPSIINIIPHNNEKKSELSLVILWKYGCPSSRYLPTYLFLALLFSSLLFSSLLFSYCEVAFLSLALYRVSLLLSTALWIHLHIHIHIHIYIHIHIHSHSFLLTSCLPFLLITHIHLSILHRWRPSSH